ncbi:hypothetical protein Psta_4686 [Pirellula staleyi DSM 6068]|uniref:Uncharacterized protein n=1 Tax=Pirellula staleyi (strain ATCC 27377 / DSM 6068 / ICPB 4128) TaxID=530564 RepID=D2R7Z7_PIRSD|nr:hypothetical protein Psta_4686 [Pirellula staleyi DSM 6068]
MNGETNQLRKVSTEKRMRSSGTWLQWLRASHGNRDVAWLASDLPFLTTKFVVTDRWQVESALPVAQTI